MPGIKAAMTVKSSQDRASRMQTGKVPFFALVTRWSEHGPSKGWPMGYRPLEGLKFDTAHPTGCQQGTSHWTGLHLNTNRPTFCQRDTTNSTVWHLNSYYQSVCQWDIGHSTVLYLTKIVQSNSFPLGHHAFNSTTAEGDSPIGCQRDTGHSQV